jgi:predicted chitinase
MRVPEIMQDPSLVETDYAFETALWFFEKNNLFAIADEGVSDDTIKQISKRVNGGYIRPRPPGQGNAENFWLAFLKPK